VRVGGAALTVFELNPRAGGASADEIVLAVEPSDVVVLPLEDGAA
jgi:hypothetical protein